MASQLGHRYDVAIVGAGICGTEAALGCAKAGLDVLLVTTILDTCYNLAGESARLEPPPNIFMAKAVATLADETGFVSSWELHRAAKYELEHTPGIHFLQSSVSSLITDGTKVIGINTWEGVPRYAKRVALCVGSFLEARLTIGNLTENAGRLSEMTYDDLYLDLLARGFTFETLRLKAEGVNDSPSYTVDCKVFKGEINPTTFASEKLMSLYAAGTCAFGYVSYEEAARQGQQLAERLVAESKGQRAKS
jgi:tRNA U34 5-carboxymethylaminomethyl modifying enzyme MnmG/GidA